MKTIEGEPAARALAHALEQLSDLVPYVTAPIVGSAAIGPANVAGGGPAAGGPAVGIDQPVPGDGEWMSGRALIDDPRWLGAVIRSTGPVIGTDDPVVAASVFVQGYSYRVLMLSIGCLCASGVVPDGSAEHMAIGLARGWPSLACFVDPTVLMMDPSGDAAGCKADPDAHGTALRFVLDRAVGGHLAPLIDAVRTGLGAAIGERLLWGNVAASAAVAFRTMDGCLGPWVAPLGERFFSLAPPALQGLGSFCVIENGTRTGLVLGAVQLPSRRPATGRGPLRRLQPDGTRSTAAGLPDIARRILSHVVGDDRRPADRPAVGVEGTGNLARCPDPSPSRRWSPPWRPASPWCRRGDW